MTAYAFTAAEFLTRAVAGLLTLPALATTRSDDDLNPDARAIPHDQAPRPAAVLIPVIRRAPELTVLLTERASHLTSHAGQIAFPGGRIDAADAGPLAAALRETLEETGIGARLIQPVGFLDGYLTRTAYAVTPVVALVEPGFSLRLDPAEVAGVFEVPLRFLMTAENHVIASREWQGKRRRFYAMPFGDRHIWGATAGMIRNLQERVYGAA